MTTPRKIKKGDKLLIHAIATTDEGPGHTVYAAIGGFEDISNAYNPSYCIFTSTVEKVFTRPIEVGDRVNMAGTWPMHKNGTVLLIVPATEGEQDGDRAVVKWDYLSVPTVPLIENLEVI